MKIFVFFSPATLKYRPVLKEKLSSAPTSKTVSFELKPVSEEGLLEGKSLKCCLLILDEKEFKKPAFRRSRRVIVLNDKPVRYAAGTKTLFLPYPDRKNIGWWTNFLVAYAQYLNFENRYYETEKAVAAYESNSEFSRSELMDMHKTLAAQDKVIELSRQEKIQYDREIKARENLQTLSQDELKQSQKVVQAWEEFYTLVREELLELRREYDAQQKAFELGQKELRDSDRTIKAMDTVTEMGRLEQLQKIENVEQLTEEDIESILSQNSLWDKLAGSDKKDLVTFIKNLFRVLLHRKKN